MLFSHFQHSKLSHAINMASVFTLSLMAVSSFSQADTQVTAKVIDNTFITSANMLAYTEFELSGEPLAEALGLDLDILDPYEKDQPTQFDYVTGIESYEYSEEAMYALNYQSQLGPHLVNGPRNALRGGTLKNIKQRMTTLAKSAAFPSSEIAKNIYPISIPYRSGSPEFNQAVDSTVIDQEEVEIINQAGDIVTVTAQIPAYQHDYKTLSWDKNKQQHIIEPAAIGGILLKEVMWSQDFLGGMHVIKSDEEVEATSANQDQDGIHALGVSSSDGMNGVILTELSLDKMLYLQNELAFDGKKLGATITPQYDANKNPVWFPHAIEVTEAKHNDRNAFGQLSVKDSHSTLRDSWMLLWPISEYFAYTDQRTANTNQSPAFTATFDGQPFASTPKVNTDTHSKNNIAGTDGFSLASNLSNMLFKNIDTLHFNKQHQTFVDTFSGKQGTHVTTYDAAYSIVALSIFQRAQDALPVGYASSDGGNIHLNTPQGIRALELINQQANFIIRNLIAKNGLVSDGITLSGKLDSNQSLDAQFSAIRGLSAAFVTTKNEAYRSAARQLYVNIDKQLFDKKLGTWAINSIGEYTPWTAAAIASAMRETMLHLKNNESENSPALELTSLVERYTSWFRTVINGPSISEGMQLSEALSDTGELIIKGHSSDSDQDNVPQITKSGGSFGQAHVLAAKVIIGHK
jgi:hypothetical protein